MSALKTEFVRNCSLQVSRNIINFDSNIVNNMSFIEKTCSKKIVQKVNLKYFNLRLFPWQKKRLTTNASQVLKTFCISYAYVNVDGFTVQERMRRFISQDGISLPSTNITLKMTKTTQTQKIEIQLQYTKKEEIKTLI